jgi:hypothetical protein
LSGASAAESTSLAEDSTKTAADGVADGVRVSVAVWDGVSLRDEVGDAVVVILAVAALVGDPVLL